MLVDSHCHLEKFHNRELLPVVLEEAEALGVGRMITVGTSVTDWELYRKLTEMHPVRVAYTVGLHPTSVEEDWEAQVARLPELLNASPKPCAMGEMGLDHFHLPKKDPEAAAAIKARQVLAFERQLQIAKEADMPIVIHSRNAFAECVECIETSGFPWEKVVFHCFADGAEEMKILKDLGGWASFTGIITYKNGQNVRDAALEQGLERLMLETDSPYLTPEPHRGKENRPGYTRHRAESCAELFGVSLEEVVEVTTANVEKFYGLGLN
jgi:TatD DNase family protein